MAAHPRRRITALSVVALALLPTLVGSSSGPGGAQPGGGSVLLLDVRALGPEGAPVLDLKADDLALKVNGQARTIRSLELLRFARPPGSVEGAPPPAELPPPFFSNQFAAMGRDIFLVFEDESISPANDEAPRQAALRLLDALEPRDRVAVATVPRGGLNVGLTTDRERVRQALSQRLGRAARYENDDDSACRTRRTFESLGDIFAGAWTGPASSVVFFSSGVTPPTLELSTISATRMGGTQTLCPVRMEDYQAFGRAARAARLNMYVVYLIDGAVVGGGNRPDGLESMAGVTDGRMFSLGRGNPGVLAPIALETSASYVLTFDAPQADTVGKALRVDVRTTRDGVKLRAPTELVIPDRRGRATARGKASNPKEMLRAGAPFLDLPLRAVSYASRNAGDDQVKLVVLFETTDREARLASAVTGAFDSKGALKAQSTSEKDDLGVSPVMAVLAVPPGAYRVRVAAADGSGRGGTVDLETTVSLGKAGPLTLSTLVLGAWGGGTFTPRLEFRSEPAAIAYLELYGEPARPDVRVTFELVAPDAERVLAAVPATVRATSVQDLRLATGELPTVGLEPGDYLVRAVVSVDGKEAGRTERTLRKN